jgi:2-methylisocitrate lyase-like PEP mutase family enzyme
VVAAARAAGDAVDIPLVINARTDVYLRDVIPAEERLVAALERGAAYLDAGADCIFVPGVRDLATIETLVKEMGGPVSVLIGAGGPTLAELAKAGVARVSYGPGPMGVAMAALSRAAEALLAGAEPPADLAFRV